MRHILLLFTLFLSIPKVYSQEFRHTINRDSLLQVILKDLPKEKRKELLKTYNSAPDQQEFFLYMFSLPKSSKKDLISNIHSNYDKINLLKKEYSLLVPTGFTVSIEFNPADKIMNDTESIDLKIVRTQNNNTDVFQNWKLCYNSDTLWKMLTMVNWNSKTLATIKNLLAEAHCVSIENGEFTTIGFARSGMGKYSYDLFDEDLTPAQIKRYNNGCNYIFYKKNIVLEYGGGAIGSQCFPDK